MLKKSLLCRLALSPLVAGRYTIEWHHGMAATFPAAAPVTIVFARLQRYLVLGSPPAPSNRDHHEHA
ncbi:MAG TPA: hypothetical protein VK597_00580 [Inquilinus sp.]|nr:hypothetical protein [Inquilinus sp.]